MTGVDTFADNRPFMLAIAYRMVGSASDAEDLVQEAFIRWERVAQDEVRSPKSYLTRIVTRLCLDHLKSSRVRHEESFAELPEPLDEDAAQQMASTAELADSLSVAFMVLLQTLSPTERAVFLLREVFDHDYQDIAQIVDKSEQTCRQIVHRAKERVAAKRPRFRASIHDTERLIERFATACRTGDVNALLQILSPDVTLYTDGGKGRPEYGRAKALRRPLEGAKAVAQFAVAVQGQAPAGVVARIHAINGQPALLTYVAGEMRAVLSFDVEDGHIRAIFVNGNADKLTSLGSLRYLT
jgi:RNA polymerase sigma-70 factor (ECF subfamily)